MWKASYDWSLFIFKINLEIPEINSTDCFNIALSTSKDITEAFMNL